MLGDQARVRVDGVDWQRALSGFRLHRAVGMAFQPSKVLAAAMVILALRGWGWVCDRLAEGWVGPASAVGGSLRRAETAVSQMEWAQALADVRMAGLTAPGSIRYGEHWLTLLWAAGALAIAGTFGLVLARLCAVHACDAKGVAWDRGARFALRRWPSATLPIVLPCVVLAALFGFGELYGLIARQSGLAWLAGMGFGLAWVVALVCLVIVMLLVFGGWLIPAAVGVEAVDGFDAASRAINYLIFQPIRALGILLIAGVLGLALLFLLTWTLNFTASTVYGWADPDERVVVPVFGPGWPDADGETLSVSTTAQDMNTDGLALGPADHQVDWRFGEVDPQGFSGWWVSFWIASARLLAQSILLSYAASAATWGYLILRQARDQVDFATHFEEPPAKSAGTASAVGRGPDIVRASTPPAPPPGVAPLGSEPPATDAASGEDQGSSA